MNNPYQSPDAALDTVLIQLKEGALAVLAGSVVGVHLQCSLAIGDFDEHSEVDFLVVIEEELSRQHIEAVGTLHLDNSAQGCRHRPNDRVMNGPEEVANWSTGLEGSKIPRSVLWRNADVNGELWYIDNGSRILERSTRYRRKT